MPKRKRGYLRSQISHDQYKVYSIRPHNYSCDVRLLVENKDNSKKLLIPVDKSVLVSIKYFEAMFKQGSIWQESSTNNEKVPIIKIQWEKPDMFGKYLKTLYGQKLKLTTENVVDIYKIADFMLDDSMIEKSSTFITETTETFPENDILKLAEFTEKFDNIIEKYINENKLKLDKIYRLGKLADRFDEKIEKYFKKLSMTLKSIDV